MSDVVTPQGETVDAQDHGTVASQDAGSIVTPEQTPQPEDKVSREDLEAQKKLQQIEMERNQLRNKLEEYEKQQDEARKAQMSDEERLRTERDEALAKLAEREAAAEAAENAREAARLREQMISEYPDEFTREAARKLIAKNEANLTWGDVSTLEEAKANLFGQLDAIKDVVNPTGAAAPQVHPNNPAPQGAAPVDRQAQIDAAAKSKDFTSLLAEIPSVKAQISQVTGEN